MLTLLKRFISNLSMKEDNNFSLEDKSQAQSVVTPIDERYEDQNFVDTTKSVWNYSILYDDDIAYFQNGSHYSLYKKFDLWNLL